MIILYNSKDNKSAYVYGIAHDGLQNAYNVNGGKAMLLIYETSFDSSWNTNTDHGWIIVGHTDNTG